MGKIIFAALALLAIFCRESHSQVEGDRIMAIVGNEIITESDFQYQIQLYARQNRVTQISPMLAQQIFQSLITSKIMLAKADQDSIFVTEDEVEKELDSRVENLIAQAGSEERLETIYGLPLARVKMLLREELTKNMKIEKLKRSKFSGGVRASEKEVREFFETYRDSLPEVGEEYDLSHIFIQRKVSDPEKAEAFRIAEKLLDSIKLGVDFSELAGRHSSDSGSARDGGNLGFAKRGTFVRPFEEAVYSLNPGQVSEPVETEFGVHIIKLNEKQGDRVRAQHILIPFPTFESSDFETIRFLDSLRTRIMSGSITFEDAAAQYSQNPYSKDKGGSLGRVSAEQLDSSTAEKIRSLNEGDISHPIRSAGSGLRYGYEIFKLIKAISPHKLSLEEDYDKIKKLADSFKESKEMEQWIEEIRESVFVDIKM